MHATKSGHEAVKDALFPLVPAAGQQFAVDDDADGRRSLLPRDVEDGCGMGVAASVVDEHVGVEEHDVRHA
jgi:hypothetical protein